MLMAEEVGRAGWVRRGLVMRGVWVSGGKECISCSLEGSRNRDPRMGQGRAREGGSLEG